MPLFTRRPLLPGLLLLIGCLICAPAAVADIYRFVDSNGTVHLTDRPLHDGYQLLQINGKKAQVSRINFRDKEANRKRFSGKIAEVASQYQVPEALLHAVITIESVYDPNATSRAGAVGLMQLMPATARRYGVYNRRNPTANLTGGTRYLKDLLKRFDNDIELALAGYNAGENAVEKYGNQIPPYDETQEYVRKVLKLYSQQSPTLSSVN
jgi:soluble lytic murein transglycosylase-like protein